MDAFTAASISARMFRESYIILNLNEGQTDEPVEDLESATMSDFYHVEVGQLSFECDNFQNRKMYFYTQMIIKSTDSPRSRFVVCW